MREREQSGEEGPGLSPGELHGKRPRNREGGSKGGWEERPAGTGAKAMWGPVAKSEQDVKEEGTVRCVRCS